MIDGIITKGIGGFYYVQTQDATYECKARGKFRQDNIIPLVGDKVKINLISSKGHGVIEEILSRETQLIRPPVANVNQALIVFAVQRPQPNKALLDRFLIMAENQGLDAVICLNKIDLDDKLYFKSLSEIYEGAGYKVIYTSTKQKTGIENLKDILANKITVFAGPSGVGKSSLLNAVQPNLELNTGEISKKTERGKHTTRHVELLELNFGGWVVDTPGFSSLNVDFIDLEDLQYLFKEFLPLLGQCKFNGCLHLNEPGCSIKQRVLEKSIVSSRYESYIQLLDEIKNRRKY